MLRIKRNKIYIIWCVLIYSLCSGCSETSWLSSSLINIEYTVSKEKMHHNNLPEYISIIRS